MKIQFLRRYTSLPILFDMLHNKRITLVSPSSWEDRNDSFYLEKYQELRKLQALLALCFTVKPETFHHWKIFAGHPGGVCIAFDKEKLLSSLQKYTNMRVGLIDYRFIKDLRTMPPSVDELPFLKRKHYEDEGEYRVIYEGKKRKISIQHFRFNLNSIKKITLSPWVPKSVAKTTKEIIWNIPLCEKFNIIRTGVIENSQWKNLANRLA